MRKSSERRWRRSNADDFISDIGVETLDLIWRFIVCVQGGYVGLFRGLWAVYFFFFFFVLGRHSISVKDKCIRSHTDAL